MNIRWHTHGLAAMLEDHDGLGPDGDMRDESLTTAGKDSIKTSDVLALLEAKYSTLHDRVLMELASRVASKCIEKSIMLEVYKQWCFHMCKIYLLKIYENLVIRF